MTSSYKGIKSLDKNSLNSRKSSFGGGMQSETSLDYTSAFTMSKRD